MGYWSTHPMGGDPPADAECTLRALLFTEEERNEELHWKDEVYKKRLEENLSTVLSHHFGRSEDGYGYYPFTFPFTIAELGIRVKDPVLSEKIKEMIGDGDASERGYDTPSEGSLEFPTKANGWNGLQSPFDYAIQLRDLWDDLMNGSISFDVLQPDQGLFAALENRVPGSGLINVK